ncbi:MAG: aspartyl protease family protein [Acetobacteraceae bacterium]|nr:aspartyl protease family protein [Acetobacteraceae bacterium]
MFTRFVVFLALVLALSACASQESCNVVPVAEMPLDARSNLLTVPAAIGGKPVQMLVDTGAERTVLSETAARRLGLPQDPKHASHHLGIGGTSSNFDVMVPGLVLGSTRFPIDRLAVADFSVDHIAGMHADGLLGADILLAFDVDIDTRNRMLTLYRARRCPAALPPWKEPAVEIQGVDAKRDRILVPIEVDHLGGLALLDTGAQATLIGTNFAKRLGVSSDALSSDRTIVAHGAGPQSQTVRLHRFHELRIGPAVAGSPVLPVVPSETGVDDGIIGGDFFSGRRVWLSFAAQRMFVGTRQYRPQKLTN